MTPAEIHRGLRLITSQEWKRTRYFPVTVIAQMAGLSRETVRLAGHGMRLTPRVVDALAPVVRAVLDGRLTARRNAWHIEATTRDMEERQFSGYTDRPRDAHLPRRRPTS